MRNHQQIEDELLINVRIAQARLKLANWAFAQNGTPQAKSARTEKSEALTDLAQALGRLNVFVLDRKIPEDLAA